MRCCKCNNTVTSGWVFQMSPLVLKCTQCQVQFKDPFPGIPLIEPLAPFWRKHRKKVVIAAAGGTAALLVAGIVWALLLVPKPKLPTAIEMVRAPDSTAAREPAGRDDNKPKQPDSQQPVEPQGSGSEHSSQGHPRSVDEETQTAGENSRGQGHQARRTPSGRGPGTAPARTSLAVRLDVRPVVFAQTAPVVCLSLSPDGKTLVSGHADRSIRFVDLGTESPTISIMQCESGVPIGLAFHPAGKHLAVLSRNHVDLYVVEGHKRILTIESRFELASMTFSGDGSLLATAEKLGDVIVRRAQDLHPVFRLSGFGGILRVAWCEQSNAFVVASADNVVRFWDVDSPEKPRALLGHMDWVSSVAVPETGGIVATGSWDRTVRVWDAQTLNGLGVLRGHDSRVTAVGMNANGSIIASGSEDGVIKIWEAGSGMEIGTIRGHAGPISSLVFLSTDWFVSASEDGSAKAWNLATGAEASLGEALSSRQPKVALRRQLADEYAETIEKANGLMTEKKYEEASQYYRKAVELRPSYAEARLCLAEALFAEGKQTLAVESFRKAVELRPDSGWNWFRLGMVLEEMGDTAKALEALVESCELLPDLGQAHLSLGWMLLSDKQYAKAQVEFEKAIKMLPASADPHRGLGVAYASQQAWEQAVSELKKAIDIKRDFAAAYSDLIDVLIASDQRRANEAQGWAQLARSQGLQLRMETLKRLEEALAASK